MIGFLREVARAITAIVAVLVWWLLAAMLAL